MPQQKSIKNFFSRKRKPVSENSCGSGSIVGNSTSDGSQPIECCPKNSSTSHSDSVVSESRVIASPESVKKNVGSRVNFEGVVRKDLNESAFAAVENNLDKRSKLLDILGEADYAAAGKDGAWALARKNIEWLHPSKVKDLNGNRPGSKGFDKRTVTIPPHVLEGKSKSQKQYWETKCKYMDTVLFFKVGKFYELYELDAEIGHRELDWKLTVSGVGKCLQVGVPESGIDEAVKKLVSRGYKVGRMEQIETGDEAKAKRGPQAMVRRELTKVVTPATLNEDDLQSEAIHLLAIKEMDKFPDGCDSPGSQIEEHKKSISFGFAFVDSAAAKFYIGSEKDDASRSSLASLLSQICPQEIIYELGGVSPESRKVIRLAKGPGLLPIQVTPLQPKTEFLEPSEAKDMLQSLKCFCPDSQEGNSKSMADNTVANVLAQVSKFGCEGLAASAMSALICHLKRIKMFDELLPRGELLPYQLFTGSLRLDGQTLKNLELLENSDDSGREGTLFGHLDSCATAAGKRLLRRWICRPLMAVQSSLQAVRKVQERQEAVRELTERRHVAGSFWEAARKLPDLERLIARTRCMESGSHLTLLKWTERSHSKRLKVFSEAVKSLTDADTALLKLTNGFGENVPLKSSLLRTLASRQLSEGSRQVLEGLEGYLVRPKSRSSRCSIDVEAVMASENEPPGDSEEAEGIFQEAAALDVLIRRFNQRTLMWQSLSESIAELDVLVALSDAATSASGTICWPRLVEKDNDPVFEAKGLWHPFAVGQGKSSIVPNDLTLGSEIQCPGQQSQPRAVLLTGPNMGGKSTLLRATCLAVIMAQMGCHVAAESLVLTPADVIFTRIGASDRIMAGESTFLVECSETAAILRDATADSIVVLDELGRGTSTFDGYAIAYAVLKHLTEAVNCRLLFATHYHPLTVEFSGSPLVSLKHMACLVAGSFPEGAQPQKRPKTAPAGSEGPPVTFLYKIREGACPKSYGLQVAELAGVPRGVVESAAVAAAQFLGQVEKSFERSVCGNVSAEQQVWMKGVLMASGESSREGKAENGGRWEGERGREELWARVRRVWGEVTGRLA